MRILCLDGARKIGAKILVSGGGRCNVTHACFDPAALVKGYPRGHKELLGPLSRFQPKDTVAWFAERGVTLKTVRAIAETGVDWISVGAITHSAPALDLGLDFDPL